MRNNHPVNTYVKFPEVKGECYRSRVYIIHFELGTYDSFDELGMLGAGRAVGMRKRRLWVLRPLRDGAS